jgi:hypothetical protein
MAGVRPAETPVSLKSRILVNALLRLVFLAVAGWFAFGGETALPGAPLFTRIALVVLALGVSILLGEVGMLRAHFDMLLAALRAGTASAAASGAGAVPRDDKAAIDVLVRALGSREPSTREKAHKHLKRITGQDLPEDPQAWGRWWSENRESFTPHGAE